MADRPIIFSSPMVRALLAGTKTQTRRLLKPQPGDMDRPFAMEDGTWHVTDSRGCNMSPLPVRYAVGDRLWVREAFIGARGYDDDPPSRFGNKPIWYCADGAPDREKWWHLSNRLRPSIHMPRWASRLTLTVTEVRVQRLQEISEEDAIAEGAEPMRLLGGGPGEAQQPVEQERPVVLRSALPVVLSAFAGLTPGQWRMVRARLDDLPGEPGTISEVLADVAKLLHDAQPLLK